VGAALLRWVLFSKSLQACADVASTASQDCVGQRAPLLRGVGRKKGETFFVVFHISINRIPRILSASVHRRQTLRRKARPTCALSLTDGRIPMPRREQLASSLRAMRRCCLGVFLHRFLKIDLGSASETPPSAKRLLDQDWQRSLHGWGRQVQKTMSVAGMESSSSFFLTPWSGLG
jgi:hypothetical protein